MGNKYRWKKKLEYRHPAQKVRLEENVLRFRGNALVRALLDDCTARGTLNMNRLYVMGFPQEDMVQFAQLIGYSLNDFMELSYVDDDSWNDAATAYNKFCPGSFPDVTKGEQGE